MYCNVCGKDDKFHSPKLWSLFERTELSKLRSRPSYKQVGGIALKKCDAIRFWQTALLTGRFRLRPVKKAS